jgi:hypothetical protein
MKISEIISEQIAGSGSTTLGSGQPGATVSAVQQTPLQTATDQQATLTPVTPKQTAPVDFAKQYKLGSKFNHPTLGQVTVKKSGPMGVTLFSDKLNTDVTFDTKSMAKMSGITGIGQ